MKHAILLAFSAIILASIPTCKGQSSGQGGGREAIRAACGPDIDKLCAGEDRIGQCLRTHMDELSEACKAGLGDRRDGRGEGERGR
jgi:hypothetical protein